MSDAARWKATVHVGGLASMVTKDHVHDAFIPFGEIVQVSVPSDSRPKQDRDDPAAAAAAAAAVAVATAENSAAPANRGFAYVEFEDPDDAKEAIDNMDQAEFFGKVIKCSAAKIPKSATEGLGSKTAVWDQEGWLSKHAAEDDDLTAPPAASGDPMQGLEGLDVAGPKPL